MSTVRIALANVPHPAVRLFCHGVVLAGLLVTGASAQDSDRPREFAEFRGTWALDEKVTPELRYVTDRLGASHPVDAIGFDVARRIVITTTTTGISVTKDRSNRHDAPAGLAAVYRFDGAETQTRDPNTGVAFIPRHSFALVAETLALTSKRDMGPDADGRVRTEVVTDAYSLRDFNTLVVERQLSVLVQPPGSLMTLARLRNNKTTLVYRRQ